MKLLSIVIPVYNAGRYIEECLNSIVGSAVDDKIEVICVDDGSTDDSLKILQEKASVYNNIKVIPKENGGVSSARNIGLENVTGKYIWFVDADDYILPKVLERLIPILKRNYEWITFKYTIKEEDVKEKKDFFEVHLGRENLPNWCLVANIIRLDIIRKNNIRFNEELKYSEDVLFVFNSLVFASEIADIGEILYFYRTVATSAMNQAKKDIEASRKRYYDTVEFAFLLLKIYKTNIKNKYIKSFVIDALLGKNRFILKSEWLLVDQEQKYKKYYPLPLFIRLRYLFRFKWEKKSWRYAMVFFPRMYLRRKIRKAKKQQA